MLWLLLSSFGDKKVWLRGLEDINVTEEEAESQRGQKTWLRSQQHRASDLQFKSRCMWTQGCSRFPWSTRTMITGKHQGGPLLWASGRQPHSINKGDLAKGPMPTPSQEWLLLEHQMVASWSFMVRKFCVATSCPRLRLCKLTLPFCGRKRKQLLEACTGGVTPDVARVNFRVVYCKVQASLVVHIVKNLPAMQETRVQFLGWDNPLEKG